MYVYGCAPKLAVWSHAPEPENIVAPAKNIGFCICSVSHSLAPTCARRTEQRRVYKRRKSKTINLSNYQSKIVLIAIARNSIGGLYCLTLLPMENENETNERNAPPAEEAAGSPLQYSAARVPETRGVQLTSQPAAVNPLYRCRSPPEDGFVEKLATHAVHRPSAEVGSDQRLKYCCR